MTELHFASMEQVRAYGEKHNKVLLVLDDCVLDATTFAPHHPGGAGFIRSCRDQNIAEQMKWHYPLSLKMANTMTIGKFKEDISRLIDPNQPLMSQIWNLDHNSYVKICDSPHWLFVDSPRMFHYDFLQIFTHNKWQRVFISPLISLLFLVYYIDWSHMAATSTINLIILFILGVLTFSLTQYLLHRFLFHAEERLLDYRLMRYLHYTLHGIHHMLPNDPDRLVFPPTLAALFLWIGSWTVYPVLRMDNNVSNLIYWIGFSVGYCSYDCMHYSLHHVDTSKSKGSYFHRLQQYHNRHHFSGEKAGYGVSSPLWDIILNTGFKITSKLNK